MVETAPGRNGAPGRARPPCCGPAPLEVLIDVCAQLDFQDLSSAVLRLRRHASVGKRFRHDNGTLRLAVHCLFSGAKQATQGKVTGEPVLPDTGANAKRVAPAC